MPAKKPKPDEKPQSERFIETAREIAADESEEGFARAFDSVVIAPKLSLSNETTEPEKSS